MDHFETKNGSLHCEDIPLASIADDVGTPFYCYSTKTLRRHYRVFNEAFDAVPHLVCYSVKANSNTAVLRVFINEGSGVDIVSGGELYRAMEAGCEPARVVYSGVGKREDEITYAIQSGILMFNVESPQELDVINACALRCGTRARISLRVNPDVNPKTHPHISTGLRENKFGVPLEDAVEEYRRAHSLDGIDIVGIACHIGSQITDLSPFVDSLDRLKGLIGTLRREGIDIRYCDLGGGLGITYRSELPPHPTDYAKAIIENADELDCTIILEPGRVIVGNAGILVTRVLYTKKSGDKRFVIVDAAMNDLVRPSLYGSYHEIEPVVAHDGIPVQTDVVGPICESGDFLAKGRILPPVERGDLLAVRSAGAYGFTMSSNYNSRLRVPEIMVSNERFYVIRKRETYEMLTEYESIPNFLIRDEE